jgi:integrase
MRTRWRRLLDVDDADHLCGVAELFNLYGAHINPSPSKVRPLCEPTSLLIDSGCDVKTVQARMRHSSAKTTLDVYGHMWPERDETTRMAIAGVIAARLASSSEDSAGAVRAKRS